MRRFRWKERAPSDLNVIAQRFTVVGKGSVGLRSVRMGLRDVCILCCAGASEAPESTYAHPVAFRIRGPLSLGLGISLEF